MPLANSMMLRQTHRPQAEREVEEVLAAEVDAEERLRLHAARREVEEARCRRRVDRVLELAAAEEREDQAEPRHHVDVDADAVARLALREVVGVEIDARR